MHVPDSKLTTVPDSNPPPPDANPVSGFQVPPLKILAANAIKNRNQFFTLSGKGIDPEIQKKYIQPMIDQLISDREASYADRIAERQENIENLSQELSEASWFRKLLSWGIGPRCFHDQNSNRLIPINRVR